MLGLEAIRITPQILAQVSAVDEFKGLWTGLEAHTTGLQLLGDVAVYGEAFHRTLKPLQDHPIDRETLCRLHASLSGSKEESAFKTEDNQLVVDGDETPVGFLETASPEQVVKLTDKLLDWVQDQLSRREMHPLITTAVFTAVFLQISPFKEGNQKLARMLVTLFMLRAGYTYAPYASLEPVMRERAGEYFRALKHNQQSLEDGRPDWSQWLTCFLEMAGDQKNMLLRRLEAKEKDLTHLPTLSGKIMKLFEDYQRLQMKEIVKLTKGRRSTIKLRLGELVKDGYLRRYGQARATWYSLV